MAGLALLALTACQFEATALDTSVVGESRSAIVSFNGLHLNGLGGNGVTLNGVTLNGVTLNGMFLNGVTLNGVTLNGVTLNGVTLNGMFLNGVTLNGVTLNGVTLNGVTLNGVTLNGVTLNGITLDGASLDPTQAEVMEDVFRYLAECALAPGQCVTIHDADGAPLTYCGVEGLDPGWASGPPDLSESENMAMCVSTRATAEGATVVHHPVMLEQFKQVMGYLVECALPAGDSVTILDELSLPVQYHGSLGLAPEWRDGPLSSLGQRKVSACLAARANGRGQTVQISMRGAGLVTGAVERALYTTHEGAFWANLFAPQPYVRTCLAEGGGLSGRVCAQSGTCGFELMGDCKSLCGSRDPGDLSYSDCAGETAVINTFLDLGKQVGFGVNHNCTRESDDSVWCWGKNNVGQLGQGSTSPRENVPLQVTALGLDSAEISAGHHYSCARKHNGSLWCWGKNNAGAVGDGTFIDRSEPVQVAGLGQDVAGLSAGTCANSTCAVKNDGSLWCWGYNQHGQVGDGSTVNRSSPVAIVSDDHGDPFAGITDTCGGAAHTCARKVDGTVWCWGQDSNHQIGDGSAPSNASRTAPVQVALPVEAAPGTLSCGCQHTCVVATDSTLWCWGDNSTGAMGDGTFTSSTSPVQVEFLDNTAVRVIATDDHTCAVTLDSETWCWGEDEYQVLLPQTNTTTPVLVDLDP